jgi:hypothetical protein
MLKITQPPWTAQRPDRAHLIYILAPTNVLGGRDVVARLEGPRREANAALIIEAPNLHDDGTALLDAIDKSGFSGSVAMVFAVDAFRQTLRRAAP